MHFWRKAQLAMARFLRLDLTPPQQHYAAFLGSFVTKGVTWLEVGCGRNIIPDWAMPETAQRAIVSRCAALIGLDVDEAMREHPLLTAKVYGLGEWLPFRDGSFDLVTANMVVEHIRDCELFLADIFRVLKPGGRFVFHTPNYWYYLIFLASLVPESLKKRIVWLLERRHENDCFVTYYRMNTLKDIRRLAEGAGFQVEELRALGSSGSFARLGPVGLLECFVLKACASLYSGRFRSNLMCALRKEFAPARALH